MAGQSPGRIGLKLGRKLRVQPGTNIEGLNFGSMDPGTHRKRPKKLALEDWKNY